MDSRIVRAYTKTDSGNPPVSFEPNSEEKYLIAVTQIGGLHVGIRFASPEDVVEIFELMVKNALTVWPEHPIIKKYAGET